jgi:hypothetical protein
LSLQPTTIAYGIWGLVKGFYFSLNLDVVPKAERVPLLNTLLQSEIATAIRFSAPTAEPTVHEPLKVEDVVMVYEGQAGTCQCGCAGEYYYNPAFDAEINARNADPENLSRYPEKRTNSLADVTRIVELINSHLKDEFKTVTRCADSCDLEVEERLWRAYTKETLALDDRVNAKLKQRKAAASPDQGREPEAVDNALTRDPQAALNGVISQANDLEARVTLEEVDKRRRRPFEDDGVYSFSHHPTTSVIQ